MLASTTFEKQFHNATTQFFTPKSMTMKSARAIQGDYLPDGGSPVASKVALDMLCWAMLSTLYRLICIAIEMAHDGGIFV